MNRTSKIVVIIVLLLVVLFGVGQFFAFSNINQNTTTTTTAETPTTPPTEVIAFAPTAPPSGTAPVEDGSCFANSIAAPYRADAWRCTVGNAISDPCFQIASSTNLLCGVNPAEGPYGTSTFLLNLTKPLPKTSPEKNPPTNWAWAVALADGTYCTPLTGTLPFTASGTVAYYGCSSPNSSEDMIFGQLEASGTTWMADVGSFNTSTSSLPTLGYSIEVPVSTVWQ